MTKVVLLGFLVILLGGCSVRESNEAHNNMVKIVRDNYELNKTNAVQIEGYVLRAVETGDLSSNVIKVAEDVFGVLEDKIVEIREDIINTTDLEGDLISIDEGTDIFYFIGEGGLLEQFFVFRQHNGSIYKLSVFWVRGRARLVKLEVHS